jgi:ubiquinone/menaquinone biosynthesis C-methylase UbiE
LRKSWRTPARQLLRRFHFLPPVFSAGALVALVFSILQERSPIVAVILALACAGFAFVAGYALRMNGIWPRLHEYRRSQYAEVWDELAVNSTAAAAAAAGFSDENELRQSGREVVERMQARVPLTKKIDVVEIACGVGRVGREIVPFCKSWTGCDISRNMLAHAAVRLNGVSNIRFVRLSGGGLVELPDASADLIYCTNALPHFDAMERWRYVRESHRVLRQGGQLYFDTVALNSAAGWIMLENNLGQRSNNVDPPYMPLPSTPDEFRAYLENAGFGEIAAEVVDSLVIVTGRKTH